jgi:hypothetical protein
LFGRGHNEGVGGCGRTRGFVGVQHGVSLDTNARPLSIDADWRTTALSSVDRVRLEIMLGMLGSDHAGERDNAAGLIERFRKQ